MRMVLHRLASAMQHGDAADLGTEMGRVGRNQAQRLGGGAEQDGVDRRLFWNAIAATGAGTVKTTWK
ncbi:hypothetical protein HNP73_000283 [Amaricoccus macauensis]|uniref:Uncharacterized protein n=1 Tax=Amaricoccus macauensis TaxID=57001 RepID=A0A840SLY6_9RHOB|nr:hypothetical protein [Amaricoccus macauensis]